MPSADPQDGWEKGSPPGLHTVDRAVLDTAAVLMPLGTLGHLPTAHTPCRAASLQLSPQAHNRPIESCDVSDELPPLIPRELAIQEEVFALKEVCGGKGRT